MMGSSGRNNIRFPFTASQWQELEHQALVFKYMVSGMPVPPDLLFTIRRSFDSSLSSKFLVHQPQHEHIGWNSFQMGLRKIDPEPGRCRRTDGKKWRCSKEAYPDSKYCERHMHRGRNRSRKPVENILSPNNNNPAKKNTVLHDSNFLSRPADPGIGLSSQQHTNFFLEPNAKREISYEYAINFSSEGSSNSGTIIRNISGDSSSSSSKLTIMGSSSSLLRGQKIQKHDNHYCACSDVPLNSSSDLERDDQHRAKKLMHHFIDEWSPKHQDSWPNNSEDHTTQLSISIPNSLHDFFITHK